jgi:HEAT repeats
VTNEEIEALFDATLVGDYDDEAPWSAVKELRRNGNRSIFEKAAEWCRSPEALKRARGSDILCQLRVPLLPEQASELRISDPIFVPESFAILSQMLATENDEQVIASAIYGLGHLCYEGSVSFIVSFATHHSDEIRFAVACALGSFSRDPDALPPLMKLADDCDEDVRDWSLFALGAQSDFDSPELRELFVRHLDDAREAAREEAIAGLAKRKDPRAALPLLRVMESGSYYTHHGSDFEALVREHLDPELEEWGTEDFIDALYLGFPAKLPPRDSKHLSKAE